jgi:hypothetical protein
VKAIELQPKSTHIAMQNEPYAKYSVTLLMTKRIITNISEDRLLGGLFQELWVEKGWEILEMRQLLQFLKDFSKKTVKKFGGFN